MELSRAVLAHAAALAAWVAVAGVSHGSQAFYRAPTELAAVMSGRSGVDPSGPRIFEQIGEASWYGRWHHGRLTASGEPFDMHELTAAHRTLPLGTKVRVTNLENWRSVDVRINDRGPYVNGRVIDLSRRAAQELRMVRDGIVPVLIEELPGGSMEPEHPAPAGAHAAN